MSLFTAETVEKIKKFIDLGNDVNIRDNYGRSILHYACTIGNLDIVKVLCDAGANINIKDDYGCPILYYACTKGNLDIVKVLCEAGANINKKFKGNYSIDKAVKTGYLDIVKYFIENYPVKLDNVLYEASVAGNIDILDYLLTLNLELNNPDDNPLILACRYGHIDVVDRLLYAGVNTNIVNRFGYTAMMEATFNNRLDILKKLVMFGANYHTFGGRSLLMSCEFSYNEISEFLIYLGCNVNYCAYNMTPLMHACKNNNLKIVTLLLKRGADPNFISNDGKKAIDYCKSNELKDLFIKK